MANFSFIESAINVFDLVSIYHTLKATFKQKTSKVPIF